MFLRDSYTSCHFQGLCITRFNSGFERKFFRLVHNLCNGPKHLNWPRNYFGLSYGLKLSYLAIYKILRMMPLMEILMLILTKVLTDDEARKLDGIRS